jgi:thiol-disulfide isomerase/thioredoxin
VRMIRFSIQTTTSLLPQLILAYLLAWMLVTPAHSTGTLQPVGTEVSYPNFNLADLKDTSHTLTEYHGKVVLVNFWASWCVPCVTEMPGMHRLQEALEDQPFEILAINVSESENRVREFIKRMNLHLTILLDRNGDTFKAWKGKVLPASFLLDRSGKIRYQVIGPLEWDSDEAGRVIEQLIQQ